MSFRYTIKTEDSYLTLSFTLSLHNEKIKKKVTFPTSVGGGLEGKTDFEGIHQRDENTIQLHRNG